MKYRQFGKTDLHVSETGLGAWAIGGGAMIGDTAIGWGDVDDNESIKAIHAALDEGINFFDTADIYGLGHSESILGKTIGSMRDIIIASKVGNVGRDGVFTTDYDPSYMRKACEQSLRRLKRDHIDYYQLHSARMNDLEKGNCISVMEELRKAGKIRYWGISLNSFEPEAEADYLASLGMGHGVQLVLNLLNQYAIPLIQRLPEDWGIIARMPLQFGLLTGKFDDQQHFDKNDHRLKRLTREVIDTSNKELSSIWTLCKKYECTKTELAMSFILSVPKISVVIPGIRTVEQARINSQHHFTLDKADMDMIMEAGRTTLKPVMDLIRKQG